MSEPFADGGAVHKAGEVVLYGAGGVGRDVCRVLKEDGIRVICMLDQRATYGEEYLGVPIYPFESCPVEPNRRAQIPLVLSIFNREVDIPALAFTMRSSGFTQVVPFLHLHAAFPNALGDRFWLTDRSYVDSHLADIADADRVWADDDSRALYRSLIALRRSGEFDSRQNPRSEETQYFPSDVPGWLNRGPLRFVDCGAYRGDTLGVMLASDLRVEASAHFEPDLQNFASLAGLVRARHHDIRGSVMLWPCAVSDRSGVVAFRDGLQEASGVSADGGTTVTAVALDDVLVGWRPTFIKMDIEGSEVEALSGARLLIGESRPSLAVCVYHKPDHLWRIPLLLSSWAALGGYQYYLRAHGFNGFDTVLYAQPGRQLSKSPPREVRS
jgi:FkbM family methyltransferase